VWSITMVLWIRKGRPRITGTQSPDPMRALTVLEVQVQSNKVRESLTYS